MDKLAKDCHELWRRVEEALSRSSTSFEEKQKREDSQEVPDQEEVHESNP